MFTSCSSGQVESVSDLIEAKTNHDMLQDYKIIDYTDKVAFFEKECVEYFNTLVAGVDYVGDFGNVTNALQYVPNNIKESKIYDREGGLGAFIFLVQETDSTITETSYFYSEKENSFYLVGLLDSGVVEIDSINVLYLSLKEVSFDCGYVNYSPTPDLPVKEPGIWSRVNKDGTPFESDESN